MNILKFKFRTLLTFLFVSVGMFVPNSAWAEFDENGFGTGNDAGKYQEPPFNNGFYQIGNAGQLYWFAEKVNKNSGSASYDAQLTNDIVVNEKVLEKVADGKKSELRTWTPIGTLSNGYTGVFLGNDHTISGLYYEGSYYNVGLFGTSYYYSYGNPPVQNAVINNVNIKDTYFRTTKYNVGGIIGSMSFGAIQSCSFEGILEGSYNVGGICGYLQNRSSQSYIRQSYSTGSVSGSSSVGGICGSISNNTSVSACYNHGSVKCSGSYAGGIVGSNSGSIEDCYNIGNVIASSPNQIAYKEYGSSISKCFYLSDSETIDGGRTLKQFKIGRVCSEMNQYYWRQSADADFPSFEGELSSYIPCVDHHYDDGVCTVCDVWEIPSQDKEGYYLLKNANNLYWFAQYVNAGSTDAKAKLTADIIVNKNVLDRVSTGNTSVLRTWNPIGNSYNSRYVGEFDGQGYSIRGLYYNNANTEYVGLFGDVYSTNTSAIRNIIVKDSYFKGSQSVGGICGYIGTASSIDNCIFEGNIYGGYGTGGICGYQYSGTINNCGFIGTVNDGQSGGGICGNVYGSVNNSFCYINNSKIDFSSNSYASINNCYCLADKENSKGGRTAKQFALGQVCYLLNNGNANPVWRQVLNKDKYPTFVGDEVTAEVLKCDHVYGNNGRCIKCDALKVPSFDENGVVLIADASDLLWFANYVSTEGFTSANARLVNDIVVNENVVAKVHAGQTDDLVKWIPIGTGNSAYMGVFDSNNKTVSGLYVEGESNVGFFGNARTIIKDLRVEDSYFKGTSYYVGGICGNYSGNEVSNCSFSGEVYGNVYVGGIIGYASNNNANISKCYNEGNITATSSFVGGICGYKPKLVTDCYNTGKITNTYYSGSAAGICFGGLDTDIITNCYNTGLLSAYFVYDISEKSYRNCYFLSAAETSKGGKTAAQFANGEVCALLNGGRTIWRQSIGNDAAPSFEGAIVEKSTCKHDYDANDVCSICGGKKKMIEPVNGFYLISNYAELAFFANEFENSCAVVNARLTNDITINEEDATSINLWTPIGNVDKPFDGIFDGDGHSIIGLKFTDKSQDYVGLFGQTSGATIKNLKLTKADILGNSYVGGICATAGHNVKISTILLNCEFEGSISGYQYVGGICGVAYNGDIQQCGNKGNINGTQYVGGISGSQGSVKNCYNWGAITSSGSYSGSIIGYRGTIDYCYNVGTPSYLGNSYSTSTKKNYYISDIDSQNGKTIEQFKNGEVCLLLNTGNGNPVWCQNVDVDQYPSFVGKNILTKEDLVCHHIFENGICSKCNGYEPATENNGWYEIANAGQLYWYVLNNNAGTMSARLVDNIIVNAALDVDNVSNSGSLKVWESYPLENAKFDGQGFSISGLYANVGDNLGLFSYIKDAEVKNVKIRNSFFNGDIRIGGICGSAENSIITNCSFDGKLSGKSSIGGICGLQSTESVISQCYNLGELYASSDNVGGITGYVPTSSGNKLIDCYNAGLIKTGNNNVHYGVVCGATSCNDLKIINCINVNSSIPHRWSSIMCSNFTFNTNSWDITNHESMFESGELCWKLNGNSTEGVWRQTLGTDKYPTFEGKYVSLEEDSYVNAKYINGFDVEDGSFEPASYNEKDDVYEISNAGQLYWFAKKVNEGDTCINGRVISNITLNKNVLAKVEVGETEGLREWTPIGNGHQYKGTFDGEGFVISGLYYNSFNSYAGLFGYCNDAKIITNVHLRDAYINGNNNPAAGICGYSYSGETRGYISKCSFDGKISGALTAGICNITTAPINDCYNLGTIVNGFGIGNAMNPSLISNSYSIGSRVVGGPANNCFYLSDEETVDGGRTAEQFANGRVCWELNNRSAEGVWRQNKEDNHPSFVGAIVDFTSCSHDYSKANGVCNLCGTKCKHEEHTTAGICLICGKTCEHQFVEGICICGSVCEHPEFKNGACAICGKICSHDHYENGACSVCGIYQTPEQDEEGYYLLANANNLYWFADYVNNNTDANINARVVNDITVNENLIKKINNSEFDGLRFWNPIIEFQGKFDGGGYIVSGLIGLDSKCGFFKSAFYAEIHGLNIRDSYFAGINSAAGICVLARGNTKISNCSFDGIFPDIKDKAGICCDNSGTIENCYNLSSIDKGFGICSENSGVISNCYNYNVNVLTPIANKGIVENCYYLSDEETADGGRTAAQFADGTVTALLNAGRTGNELVWFQNGDKPGFEQAEAPAKKLLLNDNSFAFVEGMEYDTVTYTRTGIESNWASLCLPFAFTTDDCKEGGITLFAVNGIKDGAIILEQVTSVSAGEPVLFYSSTKADLKIVVTGNIQLTNSPNEELDLKGSFVEQTIYTTDFPDREIYYLKNNQYLKGNGNFKLKPFHAFLAGEADVNVKSLRIAMPNEVVDESVVEDETFNMVNPSIFNVSGQRVSNMRNGGVYIIKKMDGTVQKVHIVE